MSELRAKYRLVFDNPIGREVLSDILSLTHFGETHNPDNQVRVAEYNVGIAILAKLGVLSPTTKNDVINALMSVRSKEDSQ